MFSNNQGPGTFGGSGSSSSNPFNTATTSSGFGSGSGGGGTGIFSATATTCSSSVFGGTSTFSGSTSSSFGGGPAFGTSATSQNTVFGGTTFGAPRFSASTTTGPFSVITTASSSFGGSGTGSISTGSVESTRPQGGTTFGGSSSLGGSTFGSTINQGTTFGGTTSQSGSTFGGAGTTGRTSFGGTTSTGSTFGGAGAIGGTTSPGGSTFGGSGSVGGTTFGGLTSQSGSTFGGTGSTPFGGSTSQGGNTFGGTGTLGTTSYGGTTSQSGSIFGGTTPQGGSTFGGTQPQGGTDVGRNPFSGAGNSSGTTHPTTSLGGSVFGGTNVHGNTFGQTSTQSTSVFGGSNTQSTLGTDKAGTSLESTGQTQRLFGVQQNNDAKAESASLFGGGKTAENTNSSIDSTGHTGGAARGGASVFGGEQRDTGRIFGGSTPNTGDSTFGGNDEGKKGGTGLFGKAVGDVTRDPARQSQVSRTIVNEDFTGDSENKRTPLRRSKSVIADDIESKVAIVCKNVPSKLNNQKVLRKHFSKFGEVTRIYPNTLKQQATVHFADHESAKTAKARGRSLSSKLEPMQIFWSAYAKPGASPGQKDTTSSSRRNTESEVKEELQGMLGTEDVQQDNSKRILRPEDRLTRPRSRSPIPIQRAPSPKPRSASPAVTKSHVTFSSLAGTHAPSAGEKYELLQKRDELLRESLGLHMKKQTELADAKTLKASCPDMCPEKERYMRQYQRRLHVYEMIPGTDLVDHSRTVKEYSRSSADQDLPLPSELRPPEVLEKTMDYLLNNIADLGEDGKWGDWYDFLWNRTRSIRKEITQLQLCDLTAVNLVEKCARFHVFCSERLCEEDMMTFDEKINNENLTKSLQTLKELYEDLWEKHEQRCPNEAEFRAYIVLMNLNEGDILRDLQTLREEVRESSGMRFVVQVHSALNSNNYIRFFKLVHGADFLSACIMHRYFTQVRTKALFTMSKAYKNNPLTLLELQRLLSFESTVEAEQFCVHHGLEVRDECIVIDKHRIVEPETPFVSGRAINVIESKQHTCVGEVINGNILPPNQIIQPAHSFDADDHFKASSLPKDLPVPDNKPVTSVRQPPTAQPDGDAKPAPTKIAYSNEAVKEVAKELFLDVIKEFSKNMSTTFVKAINVYLDKAGDVCDSVLDTTITEEAKVVVEDCLQDFENEKKELEARHRAEQARLRSLTAEGVSEEVVTECMEDIVRELAQQQYREVQVQLKEESKVRSSEAISLDLLTEVLDEEAECVAMETHETDVVERLQELEENCRAVEFMMVTRFFNKWKNAFAARLRLQKSMLTFPPGPSLESVEQQVCDLIPDSEGLGQHSLHLGKKARLTLLSPGQVLDGQARISQSLMLQRYWQRIRHQRAWAPLDVAQIVGHQLFKHRSDLDKRQQGHTYGRGCNMYWKLLVCLPEKLQDGVTTNLCNWLTSKLKSGAVPKSKHPLVSELLALYHSEVNPGCKLYVCIRTVKKVLGMNDRNLLSSENYLQGASALTFVLRQMPTDPFEPEEYFMLESSRLRLLLEEINKLGTRLPLLILVPFSFEASELVSGLELKSLEQEGLLNGSPLIAWLDKGIEDQTSSKKLMQGLTQLAGRQPNIVIPAQQTMREFIEDVLHREFYTVIYQDLAKRTKSGLLHQEASNLVSLYNSLVEHMAEIVSDQELTDVAYPVPEFVDSCPELPVIDWNSRDHLKELGDTIFNLSLPDFECHGDELGGGRGDMGDEIDWQTAVEDVWAYVDAVAESSETTRALLYSNITMLLGQARERFEEQCWGRLGTVGCLPMYANIPWTDVIVACVHHRLANLDAYVQSRQLGCDEAASLPVHYFADKLSKFGPPTEWLNAIRDDKRDQQLLNETLVKSVKRKHSDQTHSHRSPKYRQTESPTKQSETGEDLSTIDLDPDSEKVHLSKKLGDSVTKAISEEKRKSQQFEDYLQKQLKAGDSIDLGCTETLDISFTPLELQVPLFRRLSAPATTFFSPGLSSKSIPRSEDLVVTPKSFFSPGLNRSSDPPRPKSAGASRKYSADNNMSILEKFDILNSSLSSQRQANKLFEMKLQSFIDMDKF